MYINKFHKQQAPTEESINNYLTYWKNNQVTDVIRLCEEIYPKTVLENNGINVHVISKAIFVGIIF